MNAHKKHQHFVEKDELTDEEWDEWKDVMRDIYGVYISNPQESEGFGYSLYYTDEKGKERVLLSSNTVGVPTWHTENSDVGNKIDLTDSFFNLIGYAFHDAMAFTPPIFFGDETHINRHVKLWYEGQDRDYELWVANGVLRQIVFGDGSIVELKPMAEYANEHSAFGCPFLVNSKKGWGENDG